MPVAIAAVLMLVLNYVTVIWLGLCLMISLRGKDQSPKLLKMWIILKYPALLGCFSGVGIDVITGHRLGWVEAIINSVSFATWYFLRDHHDDDDFFKKLGNKLKGKIKQIGSRLVVVPEPA